MKTITINKLIKHLNSIKEGNLTIKEYQEANQLSSGFIYEKIKDLKESFKTGTVDKELYDQVISLYEEVKQRKTHKNEDIEKTDGYVNITTSRDENGKISKYNFQILIHDKPSLVGSFTRDEMALIYRLYSSYGSNITQREVSRFFPEFSLFDFKRILRAFNITKASAPFPPHIIEECSKEELLDMQFREKENDFLKSYEVEKVRNMDNQMRKIMKENVDLKDQLHSFKEVLSDIEIPTLPQFISKPCEDKSQEDLVIWLSDMHIGAFTSDYSLYDNRYDEDEVAFRLNKVYERVYQEFVNRGSFRNVIVCNLGDSLDGYNCKTARGTELSQNMNNKDQVKCFLDVMTNFMEKVVSNIECENISYYAVGESNHGSDFEYAANTALAYICESMGVNATIFEQAINFFKVGEVTYIITHGNDNKNMNRGLPLTINDKTENYLNQFIDYHNLSGNIIVAKGDLHQSATTYAKRFTYKSVGSLYGSSDWIQANFGFTKACCDYSIVDQKGNRLDGLVVLN